MHATRQVHDREMAHGGCTLALVTLTPLHHLSEGVSDSVMVRAGGGGEREEKGKSDTGKRRGRGGETGRKRGRGGEIGKGRGRGGETGKGRGTGGETGKGRERGDETGRRSSVFLHVFLSLCRLSVCLLLHMSACGIFFLVCEFICVCT